MELINELPISLSGGLNYVAPYPMFEGPLEYTFQTTITKLPTITWTITSHNTNAYDNKDRVTISKMSGSLGDTITITAKRNCRAYFNIESGSYKVPFCVTFSSNSAGSAADNGYCYGLDGNIAIGDLDTSKGPTYLFLFIRGNVWSLGSKTSNIELSSSGGTYLTSERVTVCKVPKGVTDRIEVNRIVYSSEGTTPLLYKTYFAERLYLTVNPSLLVFPYGEDLQSMTKSISVNTNDINYTASWSNLDFHHEGNLYPYRTPGLVKEEGLLVVTPMSPTQYAYPGTGIIVFKYANGIEAARVTVRLDGAPFKVIKSADKVVSSSSGTLTKRNILFNGKLSYMTSPSSNLWWLKSTPPILKSVKSWLTYYEWDDTYLENTLPTSRSIIDCTVHIKYPISSSGGSESTVIEETKVILEGNSYFSVTPNVITYGSNGGTKIFRIDTNRPVFNHICELSWVSNILYQQGISGDLKVTLDANKTSNPRVATILFWSNGVILDTITITQEARELFFDITPLSILSEKEGGSYTVLITTNIDYTYKVNNKLDDEVWFNVDIIKATDIDLIKHDVYTIKILNNLYPYTKNGSILFLPVGLGAKIVSVILKPADAILNWSPSSESLDLDFNGNITTILTSNFKNTLVISRLDGISILSIEEISSYPISKKRYTLYVPNNYDSRQKSSTLEAKGSSTDYPNITSTYRLILSSKLIFDLVDNDDYNLYVISAPSVGLNTLFKLKYNVNWTLDTPINEIPTWIGYKGTKLSYSGSTYIEDIIPLLIQNNEDTGRSFVLKYRSLNSTKSLLILLDAGIKPEIIVTPNILEFNSDDHSFELTVLATHTWSLVSEIPSWMNISKITGLEGISIITIHIYPNIGTDRFINLRFKLDDYDFSDICHISLDGLENGYDITDVEDGQDWSDRRETRLRDKYIKIRVRYKGDDPVRITGIKTLYTISNA